MFGRAEWLRFWSKLNSFGKLKPEAARYQSQSTATAVRSVVQRDNMEYTDDTPFYRLLATKYDESREQEAIDIVNEHPELATLEWPGPDKDGQPS